MCIGGQCQRVCEQAGLSRPSACSFNSLTTLSVAGKDVRIPSASSAPVMIEIKQPSFSSAPISLREILEWTPQAAA